jgi:hypothetical protein
MALFCISYDLIKGKDYQKLWDELDRLGGHKALESFYLVALTNTASEVRDHLRDFVDSDDMLMVIEFSKKPAFVKAKAGTNAWLEKNFD